MALGIMTLGLQAQQKYTTYSMRYVEDEYDIQIGDEGKLYITIMTMDRTSKSAGIILKRKKAPQFMECLDSARKKYAEWTEIAIKNNVKEMSKEIDCGCKVEGFFSFGDWQFDFYVVPTFKFLVTDYGGKINHLLVINTGRMTSSSNQYIDSDGGTIIFNSDMEIVDFIRKINPKNVEEFLSKKPNVEELFK